MLLRESVVCVWGFTKNCCFNLLCKGIQCQGKLFPTCMGILVEICLGVIRVPYFCIAFAPKAVLVPSCISKILSEREQIPLQSSHKNTKYVVKT